MTTDPISQLRQVARKLIRELGILELDRTQKHATPQYWHALIEINNEPNITVAKLGNLLLISYSTIFRIVNSLIKAGLVTSKSGVDKREKYLTITAKGLDEIKKIDEFSNKKILGALEFLTAEDQKNIIESIEKYVNALERSRISAEQVKIHTLSTSRTIRKQIINMIDDIQKHELNLPITEQFNANIIKAEAEFYYNRSYNFWYAINKNGTIIGSIGLKKVDKVNAEIKKFFVHQNYRGKGVADKLMQTLMKSALKHHFKYLYLGTVETVSAAHLFMKKMDSLKSQSKIYQKNLSNHL
jgi:DNA-binding MarR family transcriptional regulator/GNAT superfamily N-acetyltransferase